MATSPVQKWTGEVATAIIHIMKFGGFGMFVDAEDVVPSSQVTSGICDVALRAALGNRGYGVREHGLLLEATKVGKKFEHILRILPVSSFCADWDSAQEVTASVSFVGVKMLLDTFGTTYEAIKERKTCDSLEEDGTEGEHAEALKQKITYCIAFGICASSYCKVETMVVDLRTFFAAAESDRNYVIDQNARVFYFTRSKNNLNPSNGVIFRTWLQQYLPDGEGKISIKTPLRTFASSIKSTSSICSGLLMAVLRQNGYEVCPNGSFLEAFDGKRRLAIMPVGRCLSNRKTVESTPVAASFIGVKKFLSRYGVSEPDDIILAHHIEKLDLIIGNADVPGCPCIGFCVCKYSYAEMDVVLIPIRALLEQASYGSVFSVGIKSHDLFYDYLKANPENLRHALLHVCFLETDTERMD